MKIQKKIFMITVLTISLLFGGWMVPNYAANETNTQATANASASKATAATKSSNANLSDLGITPHDFTGFRYGTTSYEVTVPETTTTVEVYAKTQDSKATLTGTGKKNLEKGTNTAEVVVTAEDGTKKTYTINIIRGAEGSTNTEGETTNTENSNGLAELKINELNLSPEFKTGVYEYTAKYIGEDSKLNIETKPTDENYEIEVVGNNNLQEGENTITILVSNPNGDNVATYQVTVNKYLIDEEAIAREEAQKKEKQQKIVIGAIGGGILIVIIAFIILSHKERKELEEEFSETYSDEDENNKEEKNEESVPKALKKNEEDDEEDDDYDEIEKMPKEELKEKFLNNYSNYEEEYEIEEKESKRKSKHKGKRFK